MTDSEKEARKAARLKEDYIQPWIAVDLDGTLAEYTMFISETHIGAPIPLMVARVKQWRREGKLVKVFTARAAERNPTKRVATINAIENWCLENIGEVLPITCVKDYGCVQIYDDRAVQVEPNTGQLMTDITYINGFKHGQVHERIKEV